MDSATFLKAYKPAERFTVPTAERLGRLMPGIDPELVGRIEESQRWSFALSTLLFERLDTGDLMDTDESATLLGEYRQWYVKSPLLKELYTLREQYSLYSPERSAIGKELQHHSFHMLNQEFIPLWHHFNTTTEEPDRSLYHGVQNCVAIAGTRLAKLRENLMAQDPKDFFNMRNPPETHRSLTEGLLGEYDAAVATLDGARLKGNHWIVLPAPATFEYLAFGANVDFIAANSSGERSIGIQVKNKVSWKDVEHYDDDRVVLVDTSIDLGNTQYMELNHDGVMQRGTQTWNGLLCMEQLARQKFTAAQHRMLKGLPLFAQQRTHGFKKQIRASSTIIQERIKTKL